MAVEKKQILLKVVEDLPPLPQPVIRLGTQKTGQVEITPRLEVAPEEVMPSVRLNPPVIESSEIRTHQPGIEAIIENLAPDFIPLEQEWGKSPETRNVPWGWFALVGLLLAAAVIWSLAGVKEAESQAHELKTTTQVLLGTDEQEDKVAGLLIDRIEASAYAFFGAKTAEDLIPLVRQPDRVIPLIKQYHQGKPLAPIPVARIRQLQPVTLGNRANFWIIGVSLINGVNQDLIVEIDEAGAPRIDWETAVCHQPMAWDQFVNERPRGTSLDFRVYIQTDSFFSHEFVDSDRWDCFRLSALNGEEALFGYSPVGGEVSQQLQSFINQNQGRPGTLIVRLLVPEGIQSRRGVIIEKVLATRWIYLDPPNP